MSFFLLLKHKGRYFEEQLEPNSCLATLTSIVEKKILWKSVVPIPIILQNIILCVHQKKETHTGLQQLEGE